MLSVIIPIFNAETFLDKCIKSICNQTYRNLEIILIDDGSTDNSYFICEKYSKRDNRIKVIHKVNGGVSSARNLGLNIAHGEYITFVDSDDWIDSNMFETLCYQIENADFVVGGYTVVNKKDNTEIKFKDELLSFPKEVCTNFDVLYIKNFFNSPFSKIYKRSILGNQKFDTNVALGEDFLFNLEYLQKCQEVKTVSSVDYHYNCLNENAATKKFRKKDIKIIIYLYEKGCDFLQNNCPNLRGYNELKKRLCLNGINVLQLLFYSNEKNKYKLAIELLENNDFNNACKLKYSLPLKYDIPRVLCKNKNYIFLKLYFKCKKLVSIIKR